MSNESVIGTTIPITPAEALNKSPAPAAEETAEQPAGEKEKGLLCKNSPVSCRKHLAFPVHYHFLSAVTMKSGIERNSSRYFSSYTCSFSRGVTCTLVNPNCGRCSRSQSGRSM